MLVRTEVKELILANKTQGNLQSRFPSASPSSRGGGASIWSITVLSDIEAEDLLSSRLGSGTLNQ